MITAEEARKIAEEKNAPDGVVKEILRDVKIEAMKGEYELIYESNHCSATNTTVYVKLKELGYKVYMTPLGVFSIRW